MINFLPLTSTCTLSLNMYIFIRWNCVYTTKPGGEQLVNKKKRKGKRGKQICTLITRKQQKTFHAFSYFSRFFFFSNETLNQMAFDGSDLRLSNQSSPTAYLLLHYKVRFIRIADYCYVAYSNILTSCILSLLIDRANITQYISDYRKQCEQR